MSPALERRMLQVVVAVAGLVPVAAGLWGVMGGVRAAGAADASQVRYLSGLLLGIGLVFWACIPTIERRGPVVRVLGALVVVGGLSRLAGLLATGLGPGVALPLVMELGVTPLIVLWRERVDRRSGRSEA